MWGLCISFEEAEIRKHPFSCFVSNHPPDIASYVIHFAVTRARENQILSHYWIISHDKNGQLCTMLYTINSMHQPHTVMQSFILWPRVIRSITLAWSIRCDRLSCVHDQMPVPNMLQQECLPDVASAQLDGSAVVPQHLPVLHLWEHTKEALMPSPHHIFEQPPTTPADDSGNPHNSLFYVF